MVVRCRIFGVTTDSDRFEVLTDTQWRLLESLLPTSEGLRGRKFQKNRLVIEGILYRLRTGVPWRDLPPHFGPWKTVWKRQRRYAGDGTWDRVLTALVAMADDGGNLDWAVSVDSTVVRVHQHGATLTRRTGGSAELHESV